MLWCAFVVDTYVAPRRLAELPSLSHWRFLICVTLCLVVISKTRAAVASEGVDCGKASEIAGRWMCTCRREGGR